MKPNIVIISLDAVRAANLPFYGYHRNTTPFLSKMEKELAIYENAISSSYWTMPSVASLFTGTHTSTHGLVVDGDTLDPSLVTLPGALKRHGYRSSAFVRNVYVSEYSGLVDDFDAFSYQFYLDRLKRLATKVAKRTVARLQPPGVNRVADVAQTSNGSKKQYVTDIASRIADTMVDSGGNQFTADFGRFVKQNHQGPFFAYFHFLETHSPWRAPFHYSFNFMTLREHLKKLTTNHDHLKFLTGERKMTPECFKLLEKAYDNAIAYTDHLIEKIITCLKRQGVYENTLLVVMSDHGDNIGDHGLMFHYWCLYDTLIKIPMLIKYPDRMGIRGRIKDVVQNVDIFPTILSILKETDEQILGQPQGNDMLGRRAPARKPGFAISELVKPFGPDRMKYRERFSRFDRRLLSVRTPEKKYIHSSNGDHEFYDLSKDPDEMNNRIEDMPSTQECLKITEMASAYYDRMDRFYQQNRLKIDNEVAEDSVDNEIAEQLKSLGYL